MFYVGQEVVCIDDTDNIWSKPWVKKGNKYVISSVFINSDTCIPTYKQCTTGVNLVGIAKPNGFASCRFRPIQKKQTDISIFTALLNPINHKELV